MVSLHQPQRHSLKQPTPPLHPPHTPHATCPKEPDDSEPEKPQKLIVPYVKTGEWTHQMFILRKQVFLFRVSKGRRIHAVKVYKNQGLTKCVMSFSEKIYIYIYIYILLLFKVCKGPQKPGTHQMCDVLVEEEVSFCWVISKPTIGLPLAAGLDWWFGD